MTETKTTTKQPLSIAESSTDLSIDPRCFSSARIDGKTVLDFIDDNRAELKAIKYVVLAKKKKEDDEYDALIASLPPPTYTGDNLVLQKLERMRQIKEAQEALGHSKQVLTEATDVLQESTKSRDDGTEEKDETTILEEEEAENEGDDPEVTEDDSDFPAEAVLLDHNNTGPSIFYLPSTNQILKYGGSVRLAEAAALRFVAKHTSIPVPRVHEAYIKNGCTFIFMDKVEGENLSVILDPEEQEDAVAQEVLNRIKSEMKEYVAQLQALRGPSYGAVGEEYSEDVCFKHLPVTVKTVGRLYYGPFATRSEYNEGLVNALRNGRWHGELDEEDLGLIERIKADLTDEKVFTHGDLNPANILVDRSTGRITGIIDFGEASFSLPGQEYYTAKSRTYGAMEGWGAMLEEIFEEDLKVGWELKQEVDKAIKKYGQI
ncbi:kinase-like protein [Ascobolus immersus RN42]|uniref:Kinase-like protein n=1 Tax=Ascobolus immersus RN42 TaxID=1160509 RepID=A0A3N4IJA6_ASCIM|nr:kinase-like protein [Ascobolus immersus RN42]